MKAVTKYALFNVLLECVSYREVEALTTLLKCLQILINNDITGVNSALQISRQEKNQFFVFSDYHLPPPLRLQTQTEPGFRVCPCV